MLADKLQEFYDALVAIKTALIAKDVVVSQFTLDLIAGLVGQIQTQRNMGSKSVEFKQNAIVYGVKIIEDEADPEKRVVYTDDAVGMVPVKVTRNTAANTEARYNTWKSSWILEIVKPCMLKMNGEIDYYLDPKDQNKKVTGETITSEFSNKNYDGNAMVEYKKFYTKFSMDGENELLQVSDTKLEGFEALGFIREDGSESDNLFVSMFLGNGVLGQFKTTLLDKNYEYQYRDILNMIAKNGEGYTIETWVVNQIRSVLYLILMKNCSSLDFLSGSNNNRKCGSLIDKGAIALNQYGDCLKFLYSEHFHTGFAGNKKWEYGVIGKNKKLYLKMSPPYNLSGYEYDEITDYSFSESDRIAGSITKMKCSNEYGRIPVSLDWPGNGQTYEAADWRQDQVENAIYIPYTGNNYGLASRQFNATYDGTYTFYAGLVYLPPA